LSHGKAIKSSLSHEGHALILEDDVFFGPSSLGLIDSALEVIETNEWDILFTDICVPRTQWMVTLFEKRRELLAEQRFELYELHERVFAGATAYLVHEKSKEKVLAALSGLDEPNTPYDLFLRSCIHKRMIKGFVVFPFATSLSDFAESSQIQERKTQLTDSAWNAFRRMMWVDAERMGIDPVARLESTPASYFDEQSQNFLKILGVQLSANFVAK
jgi:GR25 family glycosyltransferase involved in LPS biosynthesis